MLKNVCVEKGDYVLISLRKSQDHKADILHKYTLIEAHEIMDMKSKTQADDNSGSDASSSTAGNGFKWVCVDNVCTLVRSDGATKNVKRSDDKWSTLPKLKKKYN